jgi:hypothetical protein
VGFPKTAHHGRRWAVKTVWSLETDAMQSTLTDLLDYND